MALSEIDGYISGASQWRSAQLQEAPPNMQRPREVRLLAPGYRRMHDDAVARLAGSPMRIWTGNGVRRPTDVRPRRPLAPILLHLVHHRGQLSLMCRLAGGTPPGIYGPNRRRWQLCKRRCRRRKSSRLRRFGSAGRPFRCEIDVLLEG